MFPNQFHNDVFTWSQQEWLHQVEYAEKAVKQGSTSVIGLKNQDTFAVVVALKLALPEATSDQKKLIQVDDHIGAAIVGLMEADAHTLTRFMRNECLNERNARDEPIRVKRLIGNIGKNMQASTDYYDDGSPYCVGLIVAGYDRDGPQIYQTRSSSCYADCKAVAIGAGKQSAFIYLKKHLDKLPSCDREELVKHGLLALRECLPNDTIQLTSQNVSIGIVGKNFPFKIYEDNYADTFLDLLTETERKSTQPVTQERPCTSEQNND